MEEEKAAAYYEELSRKGSGAARFKQGLGFSDAVSEKTSALPSSFVKASTGVSQADQIHKEAQLQSIQNKLTSKSKLNNKIQTQRNPNEIDYKSQRTESQRSRSLRCDRDSKRRSGSRSRDRDSRRRSRERDEGQRSFSRIGNESQRGRHRDSDSDEYRDSKRRSRSRDRDSRRRSRSGSRSGRRSRSRERSSRRRRSRSDEGRGRRNETSSRGEKSGKNEGYGRVDYAKFIQGYDQMAPAERVKAKMKLQLTETAKKDPTRGTGSGWERFDFDKDATLDDEEEIEAAEDDRDLVKHIGQSFRFSAVEARKEDQIKAAHDEAMFGAPTLQLTPDTDEEKEDSPKCVNDTAPDTSLISNQVISMQQVSWRDRVKKM